MALLSQIERVIRTPVAIREERRLLREYPSKPKPSGWQTTDSRSHDPANFRYIVHMTSRSRLDHGVWMAYARGLGQERNLSGNPWEVLLDDFLSQNSISCSLIDEVHRDTFMHDEHPGGFILDVPEENIAAVNPTDLGTNNVLNQQTRAIIMRDGMERKRNTTSAQAFLETCTQGFYNELLIDGIGPEGKQIRIVGMYLVTDPILGIPLYEFHTKFTWGPRETLARLTSPGYWREERYRINEKKEQYHDIKYLAQLLDVPLVRIPAPLPL